MLVDTFQALLPLLCAGAILTGLALDRRLAAGMPPATEEALADVPPGDPGADEAFAFRLLADSLIGELELRPECRDEVLDEMRREHALVVRWLTREAVDETDARG
jgi:hypothetical protein